MERYYEAIDLLKGMISRPSFSRDETAVADFLQAEWQKAGQKVFRKGMLYIGDRPTLNNGKDISMEVNILDFSGDIYNDSIRVSFVQYVRGDIKFDSLEELKAQLEKDRCTVNNLL